MTGETSQFALTDPGHRQGKNAQEEVGEWNMRIKQG
jgi:hypothetical protein